MNTTDLGLTVHAPACGDLIHGRLSAGVDGYTINAPDFVLHVPSDMSVRGTVEAIRAAHMLKAHRT